MAAFITDQTISPHGTYRLNPDHIVSYAQSEHIGLNTNVTLSTGCSVTIALTPDKIDELLRKAGYPVLMA
jgi:hypothetical protein